MSTPVTTEAALQQLNTPDRVEPPIETPAPPPAPVETPLNVDDDAAVQAALEANSIHVPDGEALIPASDAGKVGKVYRDKIKELRGELEGAKAGSAKIPQLEQQIAGLIHQVQQLTPYVQAYQQQQQAPPAAPTEPAISDQEAERYARRYDLYKADGTGALDLDRGREILTDIRKEARTAAEEVSRASLAPIHQSQAQRDSAHMLARAKNTVLPNGMQSDPAALDAIWARIGPELTSTPEGAQWALMAAIGTTVGMADQARLQAMSQPRQRGPNGQFLPAGQAPPAPVPDPVPRETSGGQPPNAPSALTESERKYIAAVGMNEADYLKIATPRFGGR